MLSITEREIQAKIGKKVKNVKNNFLMEMSRKDPPVSKTVDSILKYCIFIHYQLKIQDSNCLKVNGHFKTLNAFFSKSTFSIVQRQMPITRPKIARDSLLVSFCMELQYTRIYSTLPLIKILSKLVSQFGHKKFPKQLKKEWGIGTPNFDKSNFSL